MMRMNSAYTGDVEFGAVREEMKGDLGENDNDVAAGFAPNRLFLRWIRPKCTANVRCT